MPIRNSSHRSCRLPAEILLSATILAFSAALASSQELDVRDALRQGGVVARVGETVITAVELEREMVRRSGGAPGRLSTLEQRRALLDDLIRRRAIAETARREGYAEHPEVRAVLEHAMVAKFIREHLDQELAEVSISEQDIESFYQSHLDDYTEPERLRVALILIAVPPGASAHQVAELERRAESIRAQASGAGDDDFAALARRHSDDHASRYSGGNVGWIRRTGRPLKWGAEVVDAWFALRHPGEVGPVVRGDQGFFIVRMSERTEARLRPLGALRTGIEHRLRKARRDELREAFYARMLAALRLEVNDELLEALEGPTQSDSAVRRPPPIPETKSTGIKEQS